MKAPDSPLFVVLFALLLPCHVVAQANRASLQENIKAGKERDKSQAVIRFKNTGKWEVDLVGRTSGGTLKLRREGQSGDAAVPLKDIAAIKFNLELDEVELNALYHAKKFKEVIKAIDEPTRDILRYMDIPNNANAYIMQMLRSLFWDKQYEEVIKTCENIMRPLRTVKGPEFVEAELMKILSLQAMGKTDLTARMLDKMDPVDRKDPLATMWFHSMATLHLSTNNWRQAAEFNAQLVAYGSKDFKLMPAALIRSMEYYNNNTNFPAALQITKEIGIVAQKTNWAVRASLEIELR
ncbi:MAG: hypothetical protein VCG02_00100, partial [Verrucomicrobiota bacterium]